MRVRVEEEESLAKSPELGLAEREELVVGELGETKVD